jgi:LEA14-like dessication related protein
MRTRSIGLALAIVVFAGCASLGGRQQPLDVTLSDVAPETIGLLEQRYKVKLRLQNPNDADIAFDGLAFEIDLNDKAFAKGVSDQKGVVPRFGETVIELEATSQLMGLLQQLVQLQEQERRGVTYRLQGRLNTGGFSGGTSFDRRGELTLRPDPAKPGS